MRRALLALALVLLAVPAALVASPSCQDFPPLAPCQGIPDGGCPLDRGGTCDDLDCATLYSCNDGAWSFLQACHHPDAGTGGSPVTSDGGPIYDGGPDGCTPVVIDTTGQTTGCTPDNAFPDCPVAAAEGCAQSACLTGCGDFFLCVSPGTGDCQDVDTPCWIDVAYCTDDGQLIVTQ
jgi:hypothetical protein